MGESITTVPKARETLRFGWQEIEALEELSNALTTLIHAEAIKYVKSEVLKRTFLAGLMSSLAPLALLKIGQIIGKCCRNADEASHEPTDKFTQITRG